MGGLRGGSAIARCGDRHAPVAHVAVAQGALLLVTVAPMPAAKGVLKEAETVVRGESKGGGGGGWTEPQNKKTQHT